jgi:hypothetical protein
MKRKMSYIEEMIAEGSKYFPESRKELEDLIKT